MRQPATSTEIEPVLRRPPARSVWSTPDFADAVFVANAIVIVGFWWFSSGFEITRNASDLFNGLGRVTGLLGTYLVLWQLLFMIPCKGRNGSYLPRRKD